ncbi:hypothetical protein CALCODRAFT_443957, partial [Calocera cornea HHB12733]
GDRSGGWKMKLELTRAMLHNADLLLLDDPTDHSDAASVEWLQPYLNSSSRVAFIIVSRDSGFMHALTTNIIQDRSQKLAYYKATWSHVHREAPTRSLTMRLRNIH